jgi:hypothetical protein
MVQRTGDVMARWFVWLIAGWYAYLVVVLAIKLGVLHVPIPGWLVGRFVAYNAMLGIVVAGIICAAIFVPYGYAVASRPQWRFVGETTGWGTGAWRSAILGVVAGVVLGFTWHAK